MDKQKRGKKGQINKRKISGYLKYQMEYLIIFIFIYLYIG